MTHEAYCRLNSALKYAEDLQFALADSPFDAARANNVINAILEVFKAEDSHPSSCR